MCGRLFIKVENGKCYEGNIGIFEEIDAERTYELTIVNDMVFVDDFLQKYNRKLLNVDKLTLKILKVL